MLENNAPECPSPSHCPTSCTAMNPCTFCVCDGLGDNKSRRTAAFIVRLRQRKAALRNTNSLRHAALQVTLKGYLVIVAGLSVSYVSIFAKSGLTLCPFSLSCIHLSAELVRELRGIMRCGFHLQKRFSVLEVGGTKDPLCYRWRESIQTV